jgi:hypothetical protein
MEPEGSLSLSQVSAISPYPEPFICTWEANQKLTGSFYKFLNQFVGGGGVGSLWLFVRSEVSFYGKGLLSPLTHQTGEPQLSCYPQDVRSCPPYLEVPILSATWGSAIQWL